MKFFFIIGLSLILVNGFAQTANTVSKTDSTRVFGDTLIAFSGEKLFFEANVVDNRIVSFKRVLSIIDMSKTITVDFDFSNQKQKNIPSVTSIRNPFDQKLLYKAKMKTGESGNSFFDVNVYPIKPKIGTKDYWPGKAEVIMLTGFKFE